MVTGQTAAPAGSGPTDGGGDTRAKLTELVDRTGLAEPVVLERAIGALHRAWIGNDPHQQDIPFTKQYSDKDADVVLRQMDATQFVLAEGFRYRDWTVPAGEVTDLASVPSSVTWLVARYGRHSLPALLHDHLVDDGMPPDDREQCDTTFRQAMKEMRVPFVRRWLIWSAVSMATTFSRSLLWKVLAGAWIALYAITPVAFAVGALHPLPAAAVLVSPVVLSLLWGRRYRVGLIAAWSLLVLTVPLLLVGVATLVYLASEGIAQLVLKARRLPAHPVRLSKLRG